MDITDSFNIYRIDDLNKIFEQIKENYEHLITTLVRFDDKELPKEIKDASYVHLEIKMEHTYDEEDIED